MAAIIYLDAATFPGTLLGVDNLIWIVSAALTVASAPFFILAAYILRIATIAKRTLAIGPLILCHSERTADIEWE